MGERERFMNAAEEGGSFIDVVFAVFLVSPATVPTVGVLSPRGGRTNAIDDDDDDDELLPPPNNEMEAVTAGCGEVKNTMKRIDAVRMMSAAEDIMVVVLLLLDDRNLGILLQWISGPAEKKIIILLWRQKIPRHRIFSVLTYLYSML